ICRPAYFLQGPIVAAIVAARAQKRSSLRSQRGELAKFLFRLRWLFWAEARSWPGSRVVARGAGHTSRANEQLTVAVPEVRAAAGDRNCPAERIRHQIATRSLVVCYLGTKTGDVRGCRMTVGIARV